MAHSEAIIMHHYATTFAAHLGMYSKNDIIEVREMFKDNLVITYDDLDRKLLEKFIEMCDLALAD
jgi:hypothetical protein